MPLRPFPSPFNVGVDVAQSTRFQKYINHSKKGRNSIYQLFDKLMTTPEQKDFWTKYRSLSWIRHHKSKMACAAHIAGRYVMHKSRHLSNLPSALHQKALAARHVSSYQLQNEST